MAFQALVRRTSRPQATAMPVVKDATAKSGELDDADRELMEEQLNRILLMFGEGSFDKLRKAFVIVVGIGGVGSHCASLLAR